MQTLAQTRLRVRGRFVKGGSQEAADALKTGEEGTDEVKDLQADEGEGAEEGEEVVLDDFEDHEVDLLPSTEEKSEIVVVTNHTKDMGMKEKEGFEQIKVEIGQPPGVLSSSGLGVIDKAMLCTSRDLAISPFADFGADDEEEPSSADVYDDDKIERENSGPLLPVMASEDHVDERCDYYNSIFGENLV